LQTFSIVFTFNSAAAGENARVFRFCANADTLFQLKAVAELLRTWVFNHVFENQSGGVRKPVCPAGPCCHNRSARNSKAN